jgi:hypothetical protein
MPGLDTLFLTSLFTVPEVALAIFIIYYLPNVDLKLLIASSGVRLYPEYPINLKK